MSEKSSSEYSGEKVRLVEVCPFDHTELYSRLLPRSEAELLAAANPDTHRIEEQETADAL